MRFFRGKAGKGCVDAFDQFRHVVRGNGIAGDIGSDDLGGHFEDISLVDGGQHRLFHLFSRSLVCDAMVRVIGTDVTNWRPGPAYAIPRGGCTVSPQPMNTSRIALASDHAGYALKSVLLSALDAWQIDALDLGTTGTDPVDYPDYAMRMVACLVEGKARQGVLVCGTGIGIAMAANRHRAVRAAVCHDVTSVVLARRHNDANVLALGGRLIGEETARQCLRAFIDTCFDGGRHTPRVDKLSHTDHLR